MSKLYNIHKICHLLLSFPPDSSLKGPGSPNNHGLPSCQMFNVKLRRYLRSYPDLRFLCLDVWKFHAKVGQTVPVSHY